MASAMRRITALWMIPNYTTWQKDVNNFQPLSLPFWEKEGWLKKSWTCLCADAGDLLLASGSQDNYIRVWRISLRDTCRDDDAATSELRLKEESFTTTSQGPFFYSR